MAQDIRPRWGGGLIGARSPGRVPSGTQLHREDVVRAIEAPTETTTGRGPDEEWFYLADAGPSRWLKVVVVFETPAKRPYHHGVSPTEKAMSVTIADITFDRVSYDADGDVLYLHVGDPTRAVDFDETPEGHGVRLDAEGRVVGLTLVNPKRLLDLDGELRVTLPVPSDVPAEQLAPALV